MPLIDCLFALRDETVGKRALYFAARRGDKPLVRLLLNRGVHTFVAGGAVLNEGVRWLDITVLRVLLECGIDPETRDNNGETPFSVACRYNRLDVVKLLLDDPRVNINSRDRTGRTGLSHAAGQGHVGVVTLLLTREAMD
ncbi:putative ankyrin repeat protein (4ank) [Tuber indicum]|nr:putative ankyrin repeat protein (4ank) [Tuber indicum]